MADTNKNFSSHSRLCGLVVAVQPQSVDPMGVFLGVTFDFGVSIPPSISRSHGGFSLAV